MQGPKDLQRQVDNLNELITSLRERLKSQEDDIAYFTRENKTLHRETNQLMDELEKKNNVESGLRHEIKDLKRTISSLSQDLQDKTDDGANLDEQNMVLYKEMTDLMAKLEVAGVTEAGLRHEIADLKAEVTRVTRIMKAQQREKDGLMERIASAEEQIEHMEAQRGQVSDTVMAKQREIDRLILQTRQQNLRISELTNEIDYKKAQTASKLKAHDILTKKFQDQQQESSRMMDELMDKSDKIRILESENRTLKKTKGVFTKDLADEERKLAECEDNLKLLQMTSSIQIKKLQAEVKRLKSEEESNKKKLENLTRANKELSTWSVALEPMDQIADANTSDVSQALERQLEDKELELENMRKKYQDAMKTISTMGDALRRAMVSQDEITQKLLKIEDEMQRQRRRATWAESLLSTSTFE